MLLQGTVEEGAKYGLELNWDKTYQTLLEVLGKVKRKTVSRWICIARDLDATVLSHIKARTSLAQSFITDNKYLVGLGAEKRPGPP